MSAATTPERAWLASLLDEAAGPSPAPDSTCTAQRARALGPFVRRLGRCVLDREVSDAGTDAHSFADCLTEASQRLAESWNATAGQGCDAVALADLTARIIDGVLADAGTRDTRCGNGVIEGAEECDDGNLRDRDGCDRSCHAELCAGAAAARVCLRCPPGAEIDVGARACSCRTGYRADADGCSDVDECSEGSAACPAGSRCVNVPGSYACAFPCTEAGLEDGIAACGGPTRMLTFACRNRVIPIRDRGGWGTRRVRCDGMVIDGLDRNPTFQLDPPCFEAAGEVCPDVDHGTGFLLIEGNDVTVRNLAVRWFFDGIQTRGRNDTVENVTFVRQCDDSVTSAASAVGTVFRDLVIKDGCDKCAQSFGDPAFTVDDAGAREHYNAIFQRVDFVGCAQPLRMTDSGRFLIEDSRMFVRARSPFACQGPFFGSPSAGALSITLRGSIVSGCRRGVRIGGATEAFLDGNLIEDSEVSGVRAARSATVSLTANRILANGGRASTQKGSAGVVIADRALVDLGGGAVAVDGSGAPSPGLNLVCGNRTAHGAALEVDASLLSDADAGATAANNWWCDADPQRLVAGRVGVSPFAEFPR